MEFSIGQEFVGIYPPEAAIFATKNGLKIIEAGTHGSKTVYKLVKDSKTKEQLISEVKSLFKNLSRQDSDAVITFKGFRVNANLLSLSRLQFLLENFEANATMGSIIFVDYDNGKQMISKDDLQNIIDGIKKFQIFLVQRKNSLIDNIQNLTDDEVQNFNLSDAFHFEV